MRNSALRSQAAMMYASRPALVAVDYNDEISPEQMAKIRESVSTENEQMRQGVVLESVDW